MLWEELKNSGKKWQRKKKFQRERKNKDLSAQMSELESLKKEYQDILLQLSSPELLSDWEKFQELSKRKNHLEIIFDKEKEIKDLLNRMEENKTIISGGEDPEFISLAETELSQLHEKEKPLNAELENLIKGNIKEEILDTNNASENSDVIVEIRAGAGGGEAALFVRDLYKMYSKYAITQDWKQKILDSSQTEIGGFKEIIFELKGVNVFGKMKYEGGVHRVQRIPETEKAGRVHTSTATVAVLAKPKKTETIIRSDDLKIDCYCASGPGGQYVNKRHTAIRITHLPTGTVVTSQTQRTQNQNKENAMAILEARILERKNNAEKEKISSNRRIQIGSADRSEKIRTYNFPQNRLTDHRIKKSWHNLEEIMEGNLNPVMDSMQKEES